MKKLLALLLVLACGVPALAQTPPSPMLVTYAPTNPSTPNCQKGGAWLNTSTSHLWVCKVLAGIGTWTDTTDTAADEGVASVNAGLPAIQRATVTIAPAQIATLFTAPVTIVAGEAGFIIYPTHIHVYKQVGTAWTTTGSGSLVFRFGNAPNTQHFGIFDQASTTNFFGAGEDLWLAEAGKGQFRGLGDLLDVSAIGGAGLQLALLTANISGGTGNLIVNVWYRKWAIVQ